jgi:hypothetical protein
MVAKSELGHRLGIIPNTNKNQFLLTKRTLLEKKYPLPDRIVP